MLEWQRNLYILFLAELISVMGFSAVNPFLSLYVTELDIKFGRVEFWVGIVFSSQALTMAIASPTWGAVADRFGRKLMVQRAMFGSAIVLGLMGIVRSVEQLVLLRAMQGAVTGTVVAANTLVAASAPRQRIGYAMGLMQMGIWIGASVGPLMGGIIADLFGFRSAFFMTTALLLLAGVGVTLFVQEEFTPSTSLSLNRHEVVRGWFDILRAPYMPEIFTARFLVWMSRSVLTPFLPLFVATLLASQHVVSTVTGLAIGVTAGGGALTSTYFGRLGDRVGHRRLLLVCSFVAVLTYLSMTIVTNGWQLIALHAVVGGAMGGIVPSMTAIMTHNAPDDQMGSVYGLDSSINASGKLVAPLLGTALITVAGLRSLFVLVAGILLLMTFLVFSRRFSDYQLECR